MKLTTRPLSPLLGLEVRGLNLNRGLSTELTDSLVGWLYQYGVVCLRKQQLTPADLLKVGEALGEPVQHNEENLRLDGLPGVMSLSNADERDDRQLNGGAHWHTDLIHSESPASFTLLHAVAVPAAGGGTRFASQTAAYDALPAERRQLAESVCVTHCYEGRTDGSMPTFRHPLVRPHPVTGRKALYGAADTGIGIEGMPQEQAQAILDEFESFATQQRFVYRHAYQLHDLVIWDNAQLLHCADPLKRTRDGQGARIMHRVSVRGWPQPQLSGQPPLEAQAHG